jgi:O-antigen biosynthesis protein
VREPVAGFAHAHNVALPHVHTELVAFTDDDVAVDPGWVGAIEADFADPAVGCVTGLVVAASLETEAEQYAETGIGHGKGDVARDFCSDSVAPMFPFTAGELSTGANMSFRVAALQSIGGFDDALGAGTPARGADDLAAFADIVDAGWRLKYQPEALVRHHHHDSMPALRRQVFGYGVGYGAYVTRLIRHQPRLALRALRHALPGVRRGINLGGDADAEQSVPRHLGLLNVLGMTLGPVALLRSRREMARRIEP